MSSPYDSQTDKVMEWSSRLQNEFSSINDLPSAEVNPRVDKLFQEIEEYEDMTVDQLRLSKIGTVLHDISARPQCAIPHDDAFNFRKRSSNLIYKWFQLLLDSHTQVSTTDGNDDGSQTETEATPVANSGGSVKAERQGNEARGGQTLNRINSVASLSLNDGTSPSGVVPDLADVDRGSDIQQCLMVREWRSKIQKTFLRSDGVRPKPERMPEIHELFKTIENHTMTIEQLSTSKIGKVMKHIAARPKCDILADDEYHFRRRAKKLVEKWIKIGNSSKTRRSDVKRDESAVGVASNADESIVNEDSVSPRPDADV
ncbi:hypothetical protein CVT24_006888 [Panaeolus cyanescens]|uniref:Uncharacterized protein n=1 Tax=Panaeolus cyanescens TaxID=181874 RepID=A0A409W034_9AGAR|nr:hypothetical protein CVT24_006888 [Panaeolus cyanescens]